MCVRPCVCPVPCVNDRECVRVCVLARIRVCFVITQGWYSNRNAMHERPRVHACTCLQTCRGDAGEPSVIVTHEKQGSRETLCAQTKHRHGLAVLRVRTSALRVTCAYSMRPPTLQDLPHHRACPVITHVHHQLKHQTQHVLHRATSHVMPSMSKAFLRYQKPDQ